QVVFFVAVADEKRFLGLLGRLGCDVRPEQGGLRQLRAPGLPELTLRFARRHAYLSASAAALKGELPDPAALLPPGTKQRPLAAVPRLPPFRKNFTRSVERAFEPVLAELEGALPGEGAAHARQAVEQSRQGIAALAGQLREVNAGLTLRPKDERLELSVTA